MMHDRLSEIVCLTQPITHAVLMAQTDNTAARGILTDLGTEELELTVHR